MFEWKQSFATGVTSIDVQHQGLFALGRELHAAMEAGNGRAVVGKVLDRLFSYASMHFAHEERLMRQAGYPGFEQHLAEHDGLKRKVEAFRADFRQGRSALNVQILLFLKSWLEQHVGGSDQQLGPYFQTAKQR